MNGWLPSNTHIQPAEDSGVLPGHFINFKLPTCTLFAAVIRLYQHQRPTKTPHFIENFIKFIASFICYSPFKCCLRRLLTFESQTFFTHISHSEGRGSVGRTNIKCFIVKFLFITHIEFQFFSFITFILLSPYYSQRSRREKNGIN